MALTYSLEPLPVMDLGTISEEVIYRAPGKNELEVRKAITQAARMFFQRTGVWKEFRRCQKVSDGWYGFKHGYAHGGVLRIDDFMEGMGLVRMAGEPEGVASFPISIPMPMIGNVRAPRMAHFIEQGGYVLVAGEGMGGCMDIPPPKYPEDDIIEPVMEVSTQAQCAEVIFTMTVVFSGEHVPEWIIRNHGDTIANGAAHLLKVDSKIGRTVEGDTFNNQCDVLAMRMANGGATAPILNTMLDELPLV